MKKYCFRKINTLVFKLQIEIQNIITINLKNNFFTVVLDCRIVIRCLYGNISFKKGRESLNIFKRFYDLALIFKLI